MMSEHKSKYETLKQMAKDQLDSLDKELNEEIIRAKKRIEELQKEKKVVKQIYDDACILLGVKSVVEMKDYELEEIENRAKEPEILER